MHMDYSESVDALEKAIVYLKKELFDGPQAEALLQKVSLYMPADQKRVIDAFLAQDPEATEDAGMSVSAPEAMLTIK